MLNDFPATEVALDQQLTAPSEALIRDLAALNDDIMILGAGGKMGPNLAVLAANAFRAAGINKKVYAVSRFSDASLPEKLGQAGVTAISCDLMDEQALRMLPNVLNVVFMAGRKFGTVGSEEQTWATNVLLPARTAERYADANIVAFSTGNVYPMMDIQEGGATEDISPSPVGDYAMSCLGRERVFEYAARRHGTRVTLFRLNYAIDLRYGVLYDIASKVRGGEPISLATPCFNCIWQGSANEMALRALKHCTSQVNVLNVTGPETLSVRHVAERFGKLFGETPVFSGQSSGRAFLSNGGKAFALFGYPAVSADEMIDLQARWLLGGGQTLSKPTCFEERGGKF